MRKIKVAVMTLVLAASVSAKAQNLAERRSLSIDGAQRVIAAGVAAARARATTGVFAVVDAGGQLMALHRIDGTFAAGARISTGKARTAVLFNKPTRFFEELINKGRFAMTAVDDFTPLMGGVPIAIDGQTVGAVGVSGAASAAQDDELATIAAAALAGTAADNLEPVKHLPEPQVRAAFAKGQPLLEQENYKVHASHRDGPGQVEVHLRDTDILYVIRGSATLVTGGSVVDGKTVEPFEVRGLSIKSGQAQSLSPGDVFVVPRGVPHWFKDVSGPLDYFAVKVQ
jgi:glc operon protein GlcG